MKILNIISGGETGGSRKHVVTLLNLFPRDEVSLLVFQKGALSKEAEALGISVHYFIQDSRYDLRVLGKIARFINEQKFDIVHTHGPRSNLFGFFIRRKINAKWFATVHSDPDLDFVKQGAIGKVFSSLHKIALKKVGFLFAVSKRFKKMLISNGIASNRIKTIYNGIEFNGHNDSLTSNRKEMEINHKGLVLIMVARLHPIKGHDLVFKALSELKHYNLTLLLVGDGPIKQELHNSVKTFGIEDKVKFLGFRNDVHHLLIQSDVLLLASYSESFPFVLLEAAQAGKPVITSDVGDVRELVQPGMGWVFPAGNSAELIQAIQEAYKMKENLGLSAMGSVLHHFAKENFSLTRLFNEVRNTYVNVLKDETNM